MMFTDIIIVFLAIIPERTPESHCLVPLAAGNFLNVAELVVRFF